MCSAHHSGLSGLFEILTCHSVYWDLLQLCIISTFGKCVFRIFVQMLWSIPDCSWFGGWFGTNLSPFWALVCYCYIKWPWSLKTFPKSHLQSSFWRMNLGRKIVGRESHHPGPDYRNSSLGKQIRLMTFMGSVRATSGLLLSQNPSSTHQLRAKMPKVL